MTTIKKLIAALTAITSMASLGVGTISASAADLDAINEKILNDTASDEEKFIAEYANDSEEMKVADYVINSDISLCDAESLMQTYENSSTTTNTNFSYPYYSLTDFADGEHFMAVIDTNPSVPKDHNFDIYYKSNTSLPGYAKSTGVEYNGKVFKTALYAYFNNYDYTPTSSDISNCGDYKGIVTAFATKGISGYTSPALLMAYGFDKKKSIYSEHDFRSLFATKEYKLSDVKKDTTGLAFETVSIGDVNHDGVLTEDDSTWILRKLVNSSDLEFTFSDGLTHYTKATSELVADFDQDGEIAISDVVALNNYLS